MTIVTRCPRCRGRFPFDPKIGFPDSCPLPGCDYVAVQRDDDVIQMPSLRSARMAATDSVYRDTEKGSEVRAEMAANMAGVPVSEMSNLKITNMRDDARPGENYVTKVVNPVSQQMDLIKARGGSVGFGEQAREFARQAQSQAPRAGMNASDSVNKMFQKFSEQSAKNFRRG